MQSVDPNEQITLCCYGCWCEVTCVKVGHFPQQIPRVAFHTDLRPSRRDLSHKRLKTGQQHQTWGSATEEQRVGRGEAEGNLSIRRRRLGSVSLKAQYVRGNLLRIA